MKLYFFLCIIVIFYPVSVNAIEPDLNGDTIVDLRDTITGLQIVSRDQNGETNLSADVNGDNKIGIEEAIHVLQKIYESGFCSLDAGFGMDIYEQSHIRLCGYRHDCPAGLNSSWNQFQGTAASLSNSETLCNAMVIMPDMDAPESFGFRLTVKDKSGYAAADDKYVLVRPAPDPCRNLILSQSALTSLDLSEPRRKAIHDVLEVADPSHGYGVFIRSPDDFMMWINLNTSLSTAVHEANHMINSDLGKCDPAYRETQYLFMGTVYPVNLIWGDTQHYKIVEETISIHLKTSSRYDTYIEGNKDANGNDFRVLLDELNAYTGDGWFQFQFHNSGLPEKTADYLTNQFQIDGMVNFMVFLQYYLKSARLNYPDTYQKIKTNPSLLSHIQRLWSAGERLLKDAYPLIMSDSGSTYIFFSFDDATGLDYLKAAYSDDLLAELNRLNVHHLSASEWYNTYYAYTPRYGNSADNTIKERVYPRKACHWGTGD